MPTVTIVTPAFNSKKLIAETIASVQNQTFSDYEHIVVDDCSTDGTLDFVRELSLGDSRIKPFQLEKNSGAAVARNFAIDAAEGRYIAFLDSDDLWMPEKLETQLSFMKNTDVALSYSGYQRMTGSGEPIGEVVVPPKVLTYKEMLKSNRIGCLTAIYDTEKLGKVFMPNIRKRQDYGLWLKIFRMIPSAAGIETPLAIYRDRSDSISSNKIAMLKYNWRLYRDFERFSVLSSSYYLAWNVIRKFIK